MSDRFWDLTELFANFRDWEKCSEWFALGTDMLHEYLKSMNEGSFKTELLANNCGLYFERTFSKKAKSKGVNRIKQLLKDIPPLALDIPFNQVKNTLEDVWLHPVDMRKTSGAERAIVLKRYPLETAIHGITAFPQSLASLMMALGIERAKKNPILQLMRYYSDIFGDVDPFRSNSRGMIQDAWLDSHAAVRFLTLLNGALYYEQFKDVMPEVIIEATKYLFKDPHANSSKLKSMLTICRQSFCSMSKTAEIAEWSIDSEDYPYPKLTGVRRVVMNFKNGADWQYYVNSLQYIHEEMASLREVGLTLTANLLGKMMDADADEITMKRWVGFYSLEHYTSYTRGYSGLAHKKQVEAEVDQAAIILSYKNHLFNEWYSIVANAILNNELKSWEQFKREVPNILTSRSAGGETVEIEITLGANKLNKNTFKGQDRTIKMKLTDKKSVGLMKPFDLISPEKFFQTYTSENPGKVGLREVTGGKLPRAIFMNNLFLHAFEYLIFAITMHRHQEFDSTARTGSVGSSNDFTVGKETGNVFSDHAYGVFASSVAWLLALAGDFGYFDATQKDSNMRSIMREAWLRAFSDYKIDGAWGPFPGGLPSIISHLLGEGICKNAVFHTKGLELVKEGSKKEKMETDAINKALDGEPDNNNESEAGVWVCKDTIIELILDMLKSGEFNTLLINDTTNRANARVFIERLFADILIKSAVSFLKLAIMGDDQAMIFRIFNEMAYTDKVHFAITTLFVKVAAENGLVVNLSKSLLRIWVYEYLKKRFAFGKYVPLLGMQPFASERTGEPQLGVTQMVSYFSTLTAMAQRGMEHDLLLRIGFCVWLFRSGVKMRVGFEKIAYFYLPPAVFSVPIEMGGIGQLPWCMYGASKDGIIAMECITNEDLRRCIDFAASVIKVTISTPKRRALKEVLEKGYFQPGIDFINGNLIPDRVKKAKESEEWLINEGKPPLGRLSYLKVGDAMVEDAISAMSRIRAIDIETKLESGHVYYLNAKKVATAKGFKTKISKEFEHVFAFRFRLTDELKEMIDICPFAGYDVRTQKLVRTFGIGTGHNPAEIRPDTLVRIFKQRDPSMRRDLTPEAMFGYITHPSIIYDTDAIYRALLAMGIRDDIASNASGDLGNRQQAFAFRQNAKTFSMRDPLLTTFDMSYQRHEEIVTTDPIADPVLYDLILEMGMLFSIVNGMKTGIYSKIHAEMTDSTLVKVYRKLAGKNYEWKMHLYEEVYPKKLWDTETF